MYQPTPAETMVFLGFAFAAGCAMGMLAGWILPVWAGALTLVCVVLAVLVGLLAANV